jgi:hypothetical protein
VSEKVNLLTGNYCTLEFGLRILMGSWLRKGKIKNHFMKIDCARANGQNWEKLGWGKKTKTEKRKKKRKNVSLKNLRERKKTIGVKGFQL